VFREREKQGVLSTGLEDHLRGRFVRRQRGCLPARDVDRDHRRDLAGVADEHGALRDLAKSMKSAQPSCHASSTKTKSNGDVSCASPHLAAVPTTTRGASGSWFALVRQRIFAGKSSGGVDADDANRMAVTPLCSDARRRQMSSAWALVSAAIATRRPLATV
jgi:hypothetical protein